MEIVKEVTQCRKCPFLDSDMDGMKCTHPYWNDKGAYDNMIITQSNMWGIPEKCPLKSKSVTTTIRLA